MREIIGAAAFLAVAFTHFRHPLNQMTLTIIPTAYKVTVWPSGVVSVHNLPAVPSHGLRHIFVLRHKSSICIRIRMATARPRILPTAVNVLAHVRSAAGL